LIADLALKPTGRNSAQQLSRDLGVAVIRRRLEAKDLCENVIDVNIPEWWHDHAGLECRPCGDEHRPHRHIHRIVSVLASRAAKTPIP
jgi:hypothetical protein